jgi:hypothetical protein
VKAILDQAIAAWKQQHGAEPQLTPIHGASFGWDTKPMLAAAKGRGKRLIDPALVGNGKAKETNLYQALSVGFPDDGIERMPAGGPYLSDDDLAKLAAWIDAGMPD